MNYDYHTYTSLEHLRNPHHVRGSVLFLATITSYSNHFQSVSTKRPFPCREQGHPAKERKYSSTSVTRKAIATVRILSAPGSSYATIPRPYQYPNSIQNMISRKRSMSLLAVSHSDPSHPRLSFFHNAILPSPYSPSLFLPFPPLLSLSFLLHFRHSIHILLKPISLLSPLYCHLSQLLAVRGLAHSDFLKILRCPGPTIEW